VTRLSVATDVGVLDKAAAILAAVEQRPLALAGLVEQTGFHRATAHRLATALEAHGLLRRDRFGRFVPGSWLVSLGRAATAGLPLRDVARPVLERLVAETGESAQLYVRQGDSRLCVESVESSNGLRTIVTVGQLLPLDRGSAGKVFGDDPSVRRKGWSESVGEREAGVASVSAPIFGPDGDVIAAVSVSGPIERTTRAPGKKYAAAVCAAARHVEVAVRS
jgi:DNA-binding IclR family transcriptional regulator